MPAFIPDVPYHIQLVFIVTFSYIWLNAFTDDYLESTHGLKESERTDILRANVWRAIMGIVVFMLSFAYLKPYPEYGLGEWQQRINRVLVCLTTLYMAFLIIMLNLRPEQGREFLGFLDTSLNKPVTKEMHTYDDNCELEW